MTVKTPEIQKFLRALKTEKTDIFKTDTLRMGTEEATKARPKTKLRVPLVVSLLASMLFVLLTACSSGGNEAQERLIDIHYGSEPASSETNAFICGQRLSVLPGEKIRFRIYNYTDDNLEFIVTDEAGADLRREKLQPGLRIIPVSATEPAGVSGSGEMAHAGHEEEKWPDATQDYDYRLIIDPALGNRPNVRNELVTFPDATEDYVLDRYICAHPDILEQLVTSSISRR